MGTHLLLPQRGTAPIFLAHVYVDKRWPISDTAEHLLTGINQFLSYFVITLQNAPVPDTMTSLYSLGGLLTR